MARHPVPKVSGNQLIPIAPDGSEGSPILLGSDAWFTWLAADQHTSFLFVAPEGSFTARREQQRNGWCWYIYRSHAGKQHKGYLGKPQDITLERLQQVARRLLHGSDAPDNRRTVTARRASAALHIQTLGVFRVSRGDVLIPDDIWGTHRARAVFKLLLTRLGEVTTSDLLMDALWPDTPIARANQYLYTAISDLRRVLEPHLARPSSSTLLRSTDNGYLLELPDPHVLDAAQFVQHIAAARVSAARQDWDGAAQSYAQALALYNGPYLPDELYAEWSFAARERLQFLRIDALLEAAEVHFHLGHHRQAMELCRKVLELDNCLEAAYRALMRYQYAAGDRAQALRVYHECVAVLERELGVEPLPETSQLALQIQRQGAGAQPSGRYESLAPASQHMPDAAPEPSSPWLGNLPTPPTDLIGRAWEIATICLLLCVGEGRLLTLSGPGGTGKTRLALQVATELRGSFPDGVWFVPLAAISDPGLVAPTIAQTLGIKEIGDRPVGELLKTMLRNRQLLLLLDNFEQVLAAAPLVGELLAAAPGVRVLITSRIVLRLYGEQEFAVEPLGLPDLRQTAAADVADIAQSEAVALFVARVRAVQLDFALSRDNAAAAAAICVRLDGLPLAIELAAARAKLFTPQALLARLAAAGGLPLLTGGARDLPARQQTLRSTISWSYNLLSQEEQTLFDRLSVFVGGCTIEGAEAVCGNAGQEAQWADAEGSPDRYPLPTDLLDGLAALVDKNLIKQVVGRDGEPRFVLLETIREYGREHLAARGEEVWLQHRHARYYLRLAETAAPLLRGAAQTAWLDRLDAEHDNLRAALTWCLTGPDKVTAEPEEHITLSPSHFVILSRAELGLRLAAALWQFWLLRGHLGDGRRWLAGPLIRSSGAAPATQARALTAAGCLARFQGDWVHACALCTESLALARPLDDKWYMALALLILTNNYQIDFMRAAAISQEALDLARATGDHWLIAFALLKQGEVTAFVLYNYEWGAALLAESLALARTVGDQWLVNQVLFAVGAVAREQGDYAAARRHHQESLALQQQQRDRLGIAQALLGLARVAEKEAQYDTARVLQQERLGIERELSNTHGIRSTLRDLGRLMWYQGDDGQAQALWEECLSLNPERVNQDFSANVLWWLGNLACERGDLAQAGDRYRQSLALLQEPGNKGGMATVLLRLGLIALLQGDHDQAGACYRESLTGARQLGYNRGIAAALLRLGELAYIRGDYAKAEALCRESLALWQTLPEPEGTACCKAMLAAVQAPEQEGAPVALQLDRTRYDIAVAAWR